MNLPTPPSAASARLVHVVTLACRDEQHARRCIDALATYGRPDALAYGCAAYDFGLKVGATDTVILVEHWSRWADLDALLVAKVVPALPLYNQMLRQPFDPSRDTLRLELAAS